MRTELDKRADKRIKYQATFGGFGSKSGSELTVLLKNVFAGKQLVTDHVWVAFEPDLQILVSKLIPNQTILEFSAIAKTYRKDPLFRETGLQHNSEVDYTLIEFRSIEIKS